VFAAPRVGSAVSSAAASTSSTVAAPKVATDTTRRYVSSQVSLPSFTVWKKAGATLSPGLLFAGVGSSRYQAAIFDSDGEPVWVEPDGLNIMNLRVQEYRGKKVLTYWSGELDNGYGYGSGTILDSSYRIVAQVRATGGQTADAHEFRLTDAGTALITTYPTEAADLRAVGGPKAGWLLNCRVQEIDVATGATLLDWKAADHLDITESYAPIGTDGAAAATPYDAFHVNSIEVDTAGDGDDTLLVSARHTHALYSVHRTTGAVRWRLGGKKSDYTLDENAVFAWQHDARRLSPTAISVFDNHVNTTKGSSRGLRLAIDESAKTVSVATEYLYKDTNAYAMGNTQTLDDGHVVVGWGMGHRVTEFSTDGAALLDIDFGSPSYRTFRDQWTATPAEKPAVATIADGSGALTAYATWNGATEVASWRFDTGSTSGALSAAATSARSGFETTATIPAAKWVRAVALDASGKELASSLVTAI
jgi:Arylsulfotransferase (ASST)